jgi:hypothetical protein
MVDRILNRPSNNYIFTGSRLRAGNNNSDARLTLSTANNESIIDLCNNGNVDISASSVFINGLKVVTTSNGDATSLTGLQLAQNLDVSGLISSDGGIRIGSGVFGGTITKSSTIHEIVIDPFGIDGSNSSTQDASGSVVIMGDLVVRGNTTTIFSTNIDISDVLLTLASGSTSALKSNNAGFQLGDGYASLLYDSSANVWKTNIGLNISGGLTGNSGITFNGNMLPFNNVSHIPITFNTFAVITLPLRQDLLYGDVSANTWMDASGYVVGTQVLSNYSYIKIDLKVAYTSSPQAYQTLGFRVLRGATDGSGVNYSSTPVFSDISLGSNTGITSNNIYNGIYYDNLNGTTLTNNTLYYKLQFRRDCPSYTTISRPFGIRGSTGNYFAIQELYNLISSNIIIDNPNLIIDYANSTFSPLGQDLSGELSIEGEAELNFFGYSIALSEDGTIMGVTAPLNNGTGTLQGSSRIYKYNDTSWVQLGQDIDGENDFEYQDIIKISSNGTIAAISSPYNSNSRGSVRIFKYTNDTSWVQQGLDIDGALDTGLFGFSISLSGNGTILAVGAPDNDSSYNNAGQVHVYSYIENINSWNVIGTFNGFGVDCKTGTSVSLSSSGTILAISSPFPNNNSDFSQMPRVDIYELNNNVWSPKGPTIYGSYLGKDSKFGTSIVLSRDGLVLAINELYNPSNSNLGRVLVYNYNTTDNSWNKLGSDINIVINSSNIIWDDPFIALSSDGSIMALGMASSDTPDRGLVRLYKLINSEWIKVGPDLLGNTSEGLFGSGLSLSSDGTIVAIGSPYENPIATGFVRAYKLNYAYT